jgi:hypothetical protein
MVFRPKSVAAVAKLTRQLRPTPFIIMPDCPGAQIDHRRIQPAYAGQALLA